MKNHSQAEIFRTQGQASPNEFNQYYLWVNKPSLNA
jgi:hypothetical protein